jgi:integrase
VDAQRWVTEQTAALNKGDWIDPRAGRVTFGDFAEVWRQAQVHRPTTRASVESHLRTNLLPAFGERPINTVRPSEVQALVRRLSDRLAPATVTVAFRYLSMIFLAAVTDGLIARNPCTGTKLPQKMPVRVVPLEVADVQHIIEALPPRLRAVGLVGAGAGLRHGEALGLTVDRVDFLRRQIVVDRQLITLERQQPQLAPPKTASSVRTVPVPDLVLKALARHLEEFEPGEWGLLFTLPDGRAMPRNMFHLAWRAAVNKSGARPGAIFHDLRHFYASALIHHGESVRVVQERLGHASAKMTLDVYSHLWPASEDKTRRAIEAAFEGLADLPRTLELGN